MFNITNNVSAILSITTLINSFTIYVSWQRRKSNGGLYILLAMWTIAFWTVSAGLDYAAIPIALKVFFAKLEFTCYNSAIAFLALFALTYAGYESWLKHKMVKVFLGFIPIFNILLAWTNDWHGLLWSSFTRSDLGNNTVIFEHGQGYPWISISGYLMILIIILPLWQTSYKGPQLTRRQARLLFIASIFSAAGSVVYLLGNQKLKGVDWAPIMFSIFGIMFVLVLYGTRLLDLVPIARYKMIEQMSDCVLVLDENNSIVDFNMAAQKIFQINHELLGKKLDVAMKNWPEIIELFSRDTDNTSQLTVVQEERKRVFDTHLTLFTDNFGKQYGKLLMFSDVTEHHENEQALEQKLFEIQELNKNLRDSQSQIVAQQRRLAKQEERRRLGRDMHDSVNQSIHSLILFSETLISLLTKGNINKAVSVAERIQESGRRALKEIRLLVFETQSQQTDEITDLAAALQERFNFVESRVGVQTEVIMDGTFAHIPQKWNENLFWITIEALNNVLKHAQTSKVKVFFICNNTHLELEIADKGVGFDPAHLMSGGMGLHTMRERAELLGGELLVTSSPGKGTSVLFRAEIKEPHE